MRSKTKPFKHQAEILARSRDERQFALFMEMGTGKTKVVLDTALHLKERGEIDGLAVVAPNGVHRNWVDEECPKHLPDEAWRGIAWSSKKAKLVGYKQAVGEVFFAKDDRLAVFAMNVQAVVTDDGGRALRRFLTHRRCLFVVDESSIIKTPAHKSVQTAALVGFKVPGLNALAPYRRILDGTPVTEGPFDLYAPFRFLDYHHPAHGFTSYVAFRHHHAEYVMAEIERFNRSLMRKEKRQFEQIAQDDAGRPRYRNLDQLRANIASVTAIAHKRDCLDLPPKLYVKRYFDLAPEQRRAYDQLADECLAKVAAGEVTAQSAIALMLRLQQIACNCVRLDDGRMACVVDRADDPRGAALLRVLDDAPGKAIVWARFTSDVDYVCDLLQRRAIPHVRYDGQVGDEERAGAIKSFQEGTAQVFVGNQHAGGLGITLTAATTVVYYSNDFSLRTRLQSEDRAHRIGQEHPVTYVDLIAVDTCDEKIVRELRAKRDVASAITGDNFGEWI